MVDWKSKSTEELEALEENYLGLLGPGLTDPTYIIVLKRIGEVRAELEGRSDHGRGRHNSSESR